MQIKHNHGVTSGIADENVSDKSLTITLASGDSGPSA